MKGIRRKKSEEEMGKIIFETNDNRDFLGSRTYTFAIQRIGQEHCKVNKKRECRVPGCYTLHFIMYGTGVLKFGNETKILGAGEVFLLYEGEYYEWQPSKTDPWSYIWIDVKGENLHEFFGFCGFSPKKPYVRLGDNHHVISLLYDLYNAYSESSVSDLESEAYLLLLFGRLIKEYKDATLFGDSVQQREFRKLRNALIYMTNNYRASLTPEEIAQELNMSYRSFMRLMSEMVGMTPTEYINAMRISEACTLIQHCDYTMEQIAASVGITDQNYFSRLFKKIKGMTPTEYAERGGDDDPFQWMKEKNIDFK